MSPDVDETHDPALKSWVESANGHADFPVQNLPLGIFAPPGGVARAGIAIGDSILDLPAISSLLPAGVARVIAEPTLNALFALGAGARRALRARLSEVLSDERARDRAAPALYPAAECVMHLPARIGDYTDFYAGIHHAMNVGRLFRPDHPLLPNYKYLPIGYHGRAGSVIPSGQPVRRPRGQRKAASDPAPTVGPTARLDYELELGIWIGPGSTLGDPVGIAEAEGHISGFCLLNDWSARDIQAWEYQPLGPFLAKSFATTISPWVVTPEALAPFHIAGSVRPPGDPAPMPYLSDAADRERGGLAVGLEVLLQTRRMREQGVSPQRIAVSDTRHLYWTPAQLVAHQTSNGCNLRPGDLFGSGTISAPEDGGTGSLLEATQGGTMPIVLATGEQRRFLEDGDEVVLRARAAREGFVPIGFGECRALVLPA